MIFPSFRGIPLLFIDFFICILDAKDIIHLIQAGWAFKSFVFIISWWYLWNGNHWFDGAVLIVLGFEVMCLLGLLTSVNFRNIYISTPAQQYIGGWLPILCRSLNMTLRPTEFDIKVLSIARDSYLFCLFCRSFFTDMRRVADLRRYYQPRSL